MQCDVIHSLLSAAEALKQEEKCPKDYGTGDILYHSEVKMLEVICQNPDLNAAQLSRLMNITRAAVTQMSNKLEEKGYITRYLQEGNKKAKYYHLTERGRMIKEKHDDYHKEANIRICEYLKSLEKQEVAIIKSFLKEIRDLPISEFECSEHCHCRQE